MLFARASAGQILPVQEVAAGRMLYVVAPVFYLRQFSSQKQRRRVHAAEVEAQIARPFTRQGEARAGVLLFIEAVVDQASRALVAPAVEHLKLPGGQRGLRALPLR